jgi:hypothetical protein
MARRHDYRGSASETAIDSSGPAIRAVATTPDTRYGRLVHGAMILRPTILASKLARHAKASFTATGRFSRITFIHDEFSPATSFVPIVQK